MTLETECVDCGVIATDVRMRRDDRLHCDRCVAEHDAEVWRTVARVRRLEHPEERDGAPPGAGEDGGHRG